jgi:type IV secretory pathway VirB4 component
LRVSPTVATLDARTQFASLRRLLGSERPEIREELDRLTEVLADTLTEFDGLVPPEELAIRDAELKDLADQLDEETTMRERAEDRLGELLQAADDSPEKLTSKLAKMSVALKGALARAQNAEDRAIRLEKGKR